MGDNVSSSSGKHYTVQNDIDASATAGWESGAGFAPIGNDGTPFMGLFNGNGHALSSLTINRPGQNYVGLFGFVGNGGVVKDLGLAEGAVKGPAELASAFQPGEPPLASAFYDRRRILTASAGPRLPLPPGPAGPWDSTHLSIAAST